MTLARFPDFSSPAPIRPARAVAVPLMIERLPLATPLGRFPGPVMPMRERAVIEVSPEPSPALMRLGRAAWAAGDLLAAFMLVAGGRALTGLATLF